MQALADRQKKEKFLHDLYADERDPQLKEFLEVMAPRTKKTTWQNADATLPVRGAAGAPAAAKKAQVSLVKSKRPGGDGVYLTKTHITFEDEDRAAAAAGSEDAGAGSDDEDYQMLPSAKPAVSIDEEEEDETGAEDDEVAREPTAAAGAGTVPPSTSAADAPGAMAKTKANPGGGRKAKVYPNTPSVDEVSENGRLFVRNLAFTCTEEDLRKLFEPFGPLSEVGPHAASCDTKAVAAADRHGATLVTAHATLGSTT